MVSLVADLTPVTRRGDPLIPAAPTPHMKTATIPRRAISAAEIGTETKRLLRLPGCLEAGWALAVPLFT
jgi:hypothetical protein